MRGAPSRWWLLAGAVSACASHTPSAAPEDAAIDASSAVVPDDGGADGDGAEVAPGVDAAAVDNDGDGYFTPADCNDSDPAVHPGAVEVCNDVDDNCDGVVDEGFDKDGDGYFECPHGAKVTDCDDHDPTRNDPIKPSQPAKGDRFTPTVNPHWKLVGSAARGSGTVTLTSHSGGQAGALWWAAPYLFDHFEASFTFTITKGSGADGFTLAWIRGDDTTKVGTAGSGLGFGGLDGYAIAVDTRQGTNEPPAPFVGILAPDGKYQATQKIADVRDGLPHVMSVLLVAARVTVALDGTHVYDNWPIAGYGPFEGHWGFTGATGADSEEHAVSDVTMLFPFGQGCVP